MPPKFSPKRFEPQAMIVPAGDGDQAGGNAAVFHAAKPAHEDDREADHADDGVMNISSAGFIEMKVIDTPASAPSSAALG
jgi:hypothetical protein